MFPCVSENLILIGWQLVKQIFSIKYNINIWSQNLKKEMHFKLKNMCTGRQKKQYASVIYRVSFEESQLSYLFFAHLGFDKNCLGSAGAKWMETMLDLELNLLRDQSIQNVKVRQLRDRISVKQQSWHVPLVFFFWFMSIRYIRWWWSSFQVYWNLVNIGLGESIGISNQSTYLQKLPIWPCPSTPPHDHVVGTPLYDSWYESPGKTSLVVGKKKVSSTRPEGRYLRCSLLKKCDFYLGFPQKKMCCHSWNQPIYSNVHVFRCFLVQSLSTVLTIEFFESSIVKRFLTFLLVEMGERWSNCLALDEHKT